MVKNPVIIRNSTSAGIKTVNDASLVAMVCVIVVLIEPIFCSLTGLNTYLIGSYVTILFSSLMTLLSGINYFKAYWPYLNPNK